jgi:preprotein translocase subunit SecD
MDRKTKWRLFWLGVLVALSVATLLPSIVDSKSMPSWFGSFFDKKVQLGLDLQGGLHIVYSVDLDKAVDDKASEIKRDLDEAFMTDGVKAQVITPLTPIGAITVVSDDQALLDSMATKYLADYDEEIEALDCPADAGKAVCFRVSSAYADKIKKSALEQAVKTIRDRVDERGVAEPSIVEKGDDIIVELPGLDEDRIERIKTTIRRTAKLEFKMVDNDNAKMKELARYVESDPRAKELGISFDVEQWTHEDGERFADTYLQAQDRTEWKPIDEARQEGCYNPNVPERDGKVECDISGRMLMESYLAEVFAARPDLRPDDNHQIAFEKLSPRRKDTNQPDSWRSYYLFRTVELGGSSITRADTVFNPTTGQPEVSVTFNRYGGRRFEQMTGDNVGKRMAIILDDKVSSAPTIRTKIGGGKSTITMGGGGDANTIKQEADDLVAVLRTGSLPAPLQEESASQVGPLLGRDAVDKAKLAFTIGSLLVVFIMIWAYRASGIISIIALALNIFFMMALLAAFGATLTLPGIAAVVLTVGMAVDANIIIYERIREELRAGKSVRGAVDAGFGHGFSAILDGQLTTAAAGYVLYNYGSGPIQGFATMLLIGIFCTLFTATWCTRLFFELYIGRGRKAVVLGI